MKKKKILVGMSGGVDSTMAAFLLNVQGHEVAGITMGIFGRDCSSGKHIKSACFGPGEENDIRDARKAADRIGIPHYVVDLHKEYEEVVLDNFRDTYLSGRTPNPCVICNQKIKFGLMVEKAHQTGIDFDYFATGHYVRKGFSSSYGRFFLKKGLDPEKDQSYFLYRLTQSQLETVIFPLGEYHKTRVLEMALEAGFGDVAGKPQSQDFYDGEDYSEFFLESKIAPGEIVDVSGNILGSHKGIIHYTIGQRKGLYLGGMKQPMYVIDINAPLNQIVVGPREDLFSRELTARDLNWFIPPEIEHGMRLKARIRSNQLEELVEIFPFEEDKVKAVFSKPQMSITPGQSVVFYKKDTVIGGGIIETVRSNLDCTKHFPT